jgi:hypothetical protein
VNYNVEYIEDHDTGLNQEIVNKEFGDDYAKACAHARAVSRRRKLLVYVVAAEHRGGREWERVGHACYDLGRRISVEGRIR